MIITLCGSARFEEAWHYWNERLTLDGHALFSLTVFPSQKGGVKNWYSPEVKIALDAAHLRKIDASDAIVVISGPLHVRDRYVGESCAREIAHAVTRGKRVFYTDEMCGYAGCEDRLMKRPPCALCYE